MARSRVWSTTRSRQASSPAIATISFRRFSTLNALLLLAGIFSSLGQLCYFVALSHSSISKIALITSMEVFVTMFFSIVVFRSAEKLTRDVVLAAALGVIGTVFVILD